jgi:16S rRNA (guanine527-N7)-methyltransferase
MLNIFLELEWKVADIWTGWGFPLIPLAITNPNINFIWIDSVWKKLKAVDEFIQQLDLKNAKTINARAEEIGQNLNYRESFDFVISRATAYLPTLLEYSIPLLKIWWIFVAYKLDDKKELKSAKKALTKLWAKILKVKNYKLANQDRTLIFIEKIEKTNMKYPRKIWIPLSKPIT